MATTKPKIFDAVNTIRGAVSYLKKDSKTPQYKFLSEAKLVEVIRPLAVEYGLIMSPAGVANMQVHTGLGSKQNQTLTTWEQSYMLTHCSGEVWPSLIVVPAQGMDFGDKGVYKGLTASHKYAWLRLLFIETGDDPERDRGSDEPRPGAHNERNLPASPSPAEGRQTDFSHMKEQDRPTGELAEWVNDVGLGHALNKDDKQRWGIFKTAFKAVEEAYGKAQVDDTNKFDCIVEFEALMNIMPPGNPFQAWHIVPFRRFAASVFKSNKNDDKTGY